MLNRAFNQPHLTSIPESRFLSLLSYADTHHTNSPQCPEHPPPTRDLPIPGSPPCRDVLPHPARHRATHKRRLSLFTSYFRTFRTAYRRPSHHQKRKAWATVCECRTSPASISSTRWRDARAVVGRTANKHSQGKVRSDALDGGKHSFQRSPARCASPAGPLPNQGRRRGRAA